MTISLTTTSHPQVFPNECAFTIVGFLALAIFITLLINTSATVAPKNMTAKLPKQPGKQQWPSHLHFVTKTITMPACTMVGRPMVMLLTQKSIFFSYFFTVLITLDLAYQPEQITCLLLKNCLKKLKSDTLIFLSLLDTT